MAGSIDPADYDAPASYGSQKSDLAVLDRYLAIKEPRAIKARRQNCSSVRGQVGVVRQVSDDLLVDELKRRLRIKRKREQARERQARRRARLSRQKA